MPPMTGNDDPIDAIVDEVGTIEDVVPAKVDGGPSSSSEETRKDHAAAEIMANLIKPPPPPAGGGGGPTRAAPPPPPPLPPKKDATSAAATTTRPTAASIAAEAAAAWRARGGDAASSASAGGKKRKGTGAPSSEVAAAKKNVKKVKTPPASSATATTPTTAATATTSTAGGGGPAVVAPSSYSAGVPSTESLAALRRVGDVEFVRILASEFKRRGYSVALQIGSSSSSSSSNASSFSEEEGGGGEEGEASSKKSNGAKSKKKRERKDGTSPLSLPSFPFHPSTVFVTEKNSESWNAMFQRLRTYHDDNRGALPVLYIPPATTTTRTTTAATGASDDGDTAAADRDPSSSSSSSSAGGCDDGGNPDLALYKWTRAQSVLWKRMKKDNRHNLSLDRIALLHSLDFDRAEDMQKDIKARVLLNSSSSSSAAATAAGGGGGGEGGDGIGGDGAEDGADHKQLMMMMEIQGKNAVKWQEKFESLRAYKEMHGDTNVPRSYDDRLSKWCAVQRMRCKEFMAGDPKTPMTKAQYQGLKEIGFNMEDKRKRYDRSVIDRKWEDKFNELVQYKEKYGNCDVAVRKGFEQYKQLANWAGLMRRKYKARMTGTKAGRTTGITDEQIKKLASCGFSFSLQDDFDTRFKHLLDYKKEFGHTKVPVFYTGHNNLGRWAKRMRDGIRNNEPWMDDMRKSRLLGIDFDIAVRHVFGHKSIKMKSSDNDSIDGEMEDAMSRGYAGGEETMGALGATAAQQMDDNDFGRPSLPPLHQYPNTAGGGGGVSQFFYGYSQGQP